MDTPGLQPSSIPLTDSFSLFYLQLLNKCFCRSSHSFVLITLNSVKANIKCDCDFIFPVVCSYILSGWLGLSCTNVKFM